ncbi:MAG: alpha-E domain-containing protein, partial [Planctomycetaceae bacterium]|nr:alpha-E domain-containing protein [Planctomycetaceae bacterium]
MLSRVADSIFWMSRYLERAENVARFIDVNLNLTLDLGDSLGEQWEPLVATTGDHADFRERYGSATQQNVLSFLTFDSKNPNSILSCLRGARDNARTVRENISSAMWEEVNKFYLTVRGAAAGGGMLDSPYDFYNQIRLSSNLLVGIMDSTMSRGEGWHFARMGRLLERADKTSRIL